MPTLKGKWYFKETLDKENISTNISFSFFVNANTTHSSSIIRGYTETANYLYYYTDTQIPVYINGTWANQAYRSIEITSPTEVSEEFYNWFTKNAVDLQPTGTWRFNKTLNYPVGDGIDDGVRTGYKGKGEDYSKTFCTIQDIEIAQLVADWGDSGYSYIDLAGTYHGLYTPYVEDGNENWESEEARIITFNNNLEYLDPYFALWFYENAHSMELKLYSECYIAEASDVLKSYTKATGYTIKDFAGAIDSLGSKYIEGDFEKY